MRLAEFQLAAVDRIMRRLSDRSGSRRFLLADEVGLGKTLVASGVIERLVAGRRRPLVVVYLCSNAEIAEQNRRKLDPDARRPVRRVAQLALTTPDRESRRQIFSFTPGTSLQDGTGMAWERRLVMFLLYRLFDKEVHRSRWREFFRCGVSEARWEHEARLAALLGDYGRKLTLPFQDRLREEWRRPVPIEGEIAVLARAIDEEVDRFHSSGATDAARRRRNLVVAMLRRAVQQVALDSLDADLVILDEVQRFKEVLDQAGDAKSVASRLFRKGDVPVLILSATPYKMLTLEHEEADEAEGGHYKEFCKTLDFLRRRGGGDGPDPIRADLDRFKKRLLQGQFLNEPDPELRAIKERLEAQLKEVMCRTERNWYVEEAGKGVEEVRPAGAGAIPDVEELTQFVRLRRFLLDTVETGYQITEYWKSAPCPFTFMDWQYAVMQAIRDRGARVPEGLLAGAEGGVDVASRNQRTRALFQRVFGPGSERHPQKWRFLWLPPTYRYYRDEFFGAGEPTKFLLFSNWRFVPKAVSVLVSDEVERRLGISSRPEEATPLRFTEKRSFHVFDVCFPSVALASTVDPAGLAIHPASTAQTVVDRAERALEERLEACGVIVGDVGNDPIWQIVARLEGQHTAALSVIAGLRSASIEGAEESGVRHFERHRRRYVRWMAEPTGGLRMSRSRLRRLAQIAAWSPAVSLLRALWSMYPESRGSMPEGLVRICVNALRNYLNRPLTQAVIDGWGRERREKSQYPTRILRYCCDAHIQAVLDEYVFLLREVSSCGDVSSALEQVAHVLGLGTGTPKINVGGPRRGGMVDIALEPVARRAHLAVAFGEDVVKDSSAGESTPQAERRSAIREAFNSPFWPFVLATTSVGQEGLDFHLYCRDIIHWNLPSNPVDLEQREGRINRRDGLAIRSRIAQDWSLVRAAVFRREGDHNPWQWVFAALDQADTLQRYKHGLYPHWVYEPGDGAAAGIRRHLFFYEASTDALRYEALKEGLALYRLVFGQPRQQDLLEVLAQKISQATIENPRFDLHANLSYYMINLSPFENGYAMERADLEAERVLKDHDEDRRREVLKRLVSDVKRISVSRKDELEDVREDLSRLIAWVEEVVVGKVDGRRLRQAIAALVYLRNPYDRFFDTHPHVGLRDDIDVIREACRSTFAAAGRD